jgi:hypothetical protein
VIILYSAVSDKDFFEVSTGPMVRFFEADIAVFLTAKVIINQFFADLRHIIISLITADSNSPQVTVHNVQFTPKTIGQPAPRGVPRPRKFKAARG